LPGEADDDAGRTYVVEPRSEAVLGDVSDADGETVRYSFYVGRIGAEPDAGQCYRLPYPEGRAFTVSQAYGPGMTSHANRQNRYAVDFAMPEGVPVVASRSGVVADATLRHRAGGPQASLGRRANRVTIVHDDGTVAQYAHLAHEAPVVERGHRVQAGTVLGRSGNTGYTGGPHLHFVVTRPAIVAGKVRPVSLPVCFYTGTPPVAFAPAVGMKPIAAYEPGPQPVALHALEPH
jgi:murein DD-endopeptidase MepM/ murein hydrolase activator NlpD